MIWLGWRVWLVALGLVVGGWSMRASAPTIYTLIRGATVSDDSGSCIFDLGHGPEMSGSLVLHQDGVPCQIMRSLIKTRGALQFVVEAP